MYRIASDVSLRDVLEADLPIFFAYELDPDAQVMAAFTSKDRDNREALLAHWHQILVDLASIIRAIVVDEQVAGSGISYYDDGHPEVSYWLGKNHWHTPIRLARSEHRASVDQRVRFAGTHPHTRPAGLLYGVETGEVVDRYCEFTYSAALDCMLLPGKAAMPEQSSEQISVVLDALYHQESRRVLATLIRLLGDFDLAEEALHDAFRAALEQWPRDSVPANPRAWLVSAGRFKAIDTLRRRARFDKALADLAEQIDRDTQNDVGLDASIEDDRLRLIFTCCHPALAPEARVALTLREVCGLTTEEIARAFLTAPSTLAQRIVRAKAKIRDARIPYQVPSPAELPERLASVLQVLYLVFNEGYSASAGDAVTRFDLSGEAIRVARLLVALLPQAEAQGLLALMLIHESRRAARTSPKGELIPLEDQDRSLWNAAQIAEGTALIEQALAAPQFGPYTVQAAIANVHANAPTVAATDWDEIVALYDLLLRVTPSPIIELNRAVAVAMRDGPAAGLTLIDAILASGDLADYHLLHAARADLCRRLGRTAEARAAYQQALDLAQQEPERRFLERRLAEMTR